MNDSTRHPLHASPLHDAPHAHVRESGADAVGTHLVGLADSALRTARRRQRLARIGAGIAAAAMAATAWVTVADSAPWQAHGAPPAAGGDTAKAAALSLLPATSATELACAPGSGGYNVHATATQPQRCVHADEARAMTNVRVASAKAQKSTADGAWLVEATSSPTDRTHFATLTGSLASAPAPRNEFAIVIDGKLWGTPFATASPTGGRLDIPGLHTGELTGTAAHNLAQRLDPGRRPAAHRASRAFRPRRSQLTAVPARRSPPYPRP